MTETEAIAAVAETTNAEAATPAAVDEDAPECHPSTVGAMAIAHTVELNAVQNAPATSTVLPTQTCKEVAPTTVTGCDGVGQLNLNQQCSILL
jgi:hypothetical protein